MELKCDLCGDTSEIRHIMEKLWVQEDLLGTHIHICQSCFYEYYPAEVRKQISDIEVKIISKLQGDK